MNWSVFPPRYGNCKSVVVNKHLEIPSVQSKATAGRRRIKGVLAGMKTAIDDSGSQDRNSWAVEPLWAQQGWLLLSYTDLTYNRLLQESQRADPDTFPPPDFARQTLHSFLGHLNSFYHHSLGF